MALINSGDLAQSARCSILRPDLLLEPEFPQNCGGILVSPGALSPPRAIAENTGKRTMVPEEGFVPFLEKKIIGQPENAMEEICGSPTSTQEWFLEPLGTNFSVQDEIGGSEFPEDIDGSSMSPSCTENSGYASELEDMGCYELFEAKVLGPEGPPGVGVPMFLARHRTRMLS